MEKEIIKTIINTKSGQPSFLDEDNVWHHPYRLGNSAFVFWMNDEKAETFSKILYRDDKEVVPAQVDTPKKWWQLL